MVNTSTVCTDLLTQLVDIALLGRRGLSGAGKRRCGSESVGQGHDFVPYYRLKHHPAICHACQQGPVGRTEG